MKNKAIILSFTILVVLFIYLLPYYQKAKVTIEYEVNGNETIQIYWKLSGLAGKKSGYSEERSVIRKVYKKNNKSEFILPSLKRIDRARIDPAKRKTKLTINSITIKQPGYTEVRINKRDQWNEIKFLNDIDLIGVKNNKFILLTLSIDPQFELNITPQFSYFRCLSETISQIAKVVAKRMDLLGLSWISIVVLIADMLIIFSFCATFIQFYKSDVPTMGELCLALGLIGLCFVVSTTTILGMIYLLSWQNLLILHIILWIGIHIVYGKRYDRRIFTMAFENAKFVFSSILSPVRNVLVPRYNNPRNYLNSLLLITILFLLLYYIIPAAFTLPLNYDANDYRLSRIGYWLQEGNVWQFATNDIRQKILAANCDLVMLWITSFFPKGYPLVHLASFFGGLMACVAIYEFCKVLGFPMHWRLSAVIFWLGIPNSATQMLTSQTDLFTTGCLMGGLFFLYMSFRKNRMTCFCLAGLGIGLAVGAKGTVFFWGPGLFLLFITMLFFYRPKLKVLIPGMSSLTLVLIGCGGFAYIQNLYHFDTPFGPSRVAKSFKDSRPAKDKTKPGKPVLGRFEVDRLKAQAYLWQIFEPSSNLPAIHAVTNVIFNTIENNLKEKFERVKSSFVGRFNQGAKWVRIVSMSEDYLSFGFISFLFFLAGGVIACIMAVVSRDALAVHMAVMFFSVLLYFIFYCHMAGWTVHRYRYAVLVTPFIAIISIYFFSQIVSVKGNYLRLIMITITLSTITYQAYMSFYIASNSLSHGWKSFISPARAGNYINYWIDADSLVKKIKNRSNKNRLGLFLSSGSWSSLFFRQGPSIHSKYIASDKSIDVNEKIFDNKHINIMITKKLSSVNVEGSFNLIRSGRNYLHALALTKSDDELKPWVITKGRWRDGWVRPKGKIIIGNWQREVYPIEVCNPAPVPQTVLLSSSKYKKKLSFEAHDEICQKVDIYVRENDRLGWRVQPGYFPSKLTGSKEKRSLGVKMKLPKY